MRSAGHETTIQLIFLFSFGFFPLYTLKFFPLDALFPLPRLRIIQINLYYWFNIIIIIVVVVVVVVFNVIV